MLHPGPDGFGSDGGWDDGGTHGSDGSPHTSAPAMTIAVVLLVIAGVGLVWGAAQRTSLSEFRPSASLPSQLPPWPDVLERMVAAMPGVPGARITERTADVVLVSAGPSMQCLSRGAGLFVRLTRTGDGVLVEGRSKVSVNTNASAALTEFERQLRRAVEGMTPR